MSEVVRSVRRVALLCLLMSRVASPLAAAQDASYWVVDRVTRCPDAPIKRPPSDRDELLEETDYYPDAFLRQVADDGANGLWITVRFRETADTPYYPRDPLAERRLEKLRSLVAKCAPYGIKIWLFAIEPVSMDADDPLLVAHPGAGGPLSWWGDRRARVSCLSDPATTNYLNLAVRDVFTRVPGLGGLIAITNGERPTTCFSMLNPRKDAPAPCPRCAKRTSGELHAALTKALAEGLRAAEPSAKFVSWLYHPQSIPTRGTWVRDCARGVPDGVTVMYNFESGCERLQAGKMRCGGDYWLAQPGPAAPFRALAAVAREEGTPLGAKIQVSCSHEIATLPYVPVPGLLYRKYKALREEGVSFVMQCWFFGGTPGLMGRAAGELSKADFAEKEGDFLLRFARRDWGEDAGEMARLWGRFSDAYSNYPLSITMQYYGPFHASCVWDLLPDVSVRSLTRTWKSDSGVSGDLVGEALEDFSLEDALEQAEKMCAPLASPDVAASLQALRAKYAADPARRRELGVMVALRDIFVGGRDVFAFYLARRRALFASRERGETATALAEAQKMRAILDRAEALTREILVLAEDDPRLGYHPEADRRQFDPASLKRRLDSLAASRRRLDEIVAELAAGRAWPKSARELGGDVWKAARDESGALVVEGVAEGPGSRNVELRLYDLCGTATATVVTTRADEEGRFRAVVPVPAERELRPAWMVVRRGSDLSHGAEWIWPARQEFHESRLRQSRVTGDNFGRVEW